MFNFPNLHRVNIVKLSIFMVVMYYDMLMFCMVHQMYPDWNSHMEMERSQESNKQGR